MYRIELRMEVATRHEIEILSVPLELFPELSEAQFTEKQDINRQRVIARK